MSRSPSVVPALASEAAEPLRPVPAPHAGPQPAPEPRPAVLLGLVLLAVLLPRALVFPFAENLYGDGVARTELAQRWLREPHVITAYGDGAFQFGPLQLYLTAVPLALGVDARDAGRWVSLLAGVLAVLPLFALTRRLFGWRAGVVAVLGFSIWGMHLQMSTTAGSESVSLALVLWALHLFARGWDEGRLAPLAGAAGVLNLACATRYDVWLLPPLLALLLLLQKGDRVAAITRAVFFGLLCLPFPLLWMQGNELAHGHPFFPMRDIQSFHDAWVAEGVGRYGGALYRLHNLLFWPGAALVTLSPLVALFGLAGLWRTWREEPHDRWLVWVVLATTGCFAFRGAVLLDFVPLARFTVVQVALLLPFVHTGATALLEGRGVATRRTVVGLAALLAVALPLGLGLYTWKNDAPVATSLKPVSPVATNPVHVMAVVDLLRAQALPGDAVVALDEDPAYMDVQIGFFSGLPESRLLRHRWGENFLKRLDRRVPDFVVLLKGGKLAALPGLVLSGETLSWRGATYEPVPGTSAEARLFRRR